MTWPLDPDEYGDEHRRHSLPYEPGRRVYVPPQRVVQLNRTWMGLKPNEKNPLVWEAIAERVFRPQGIIAVAAPVGALLHDFSIGSRRILPMGVPVALETFTELDRVLGERPPARPSFPPMEVGMRLCIQVTAPDGTSPLVWPTSLTIWGLVPETF